MSIQQQLEANQEHPDTVQYQLRKHLKQLQKQEEPREMIISGQVRNSSLFKDIKQSPIAGGKAISIAMRMGSRDQRQRKSR